MSFLKKHIQKSYHRNAVWAVLRFSLLTVVLPGLLMTGICAYLYQRAVDHFIADSYAHQSVMLNNAMSIIRYRLQVAQNDIRFMAANPLLKQFLDCDQNCDRQMMSQFFVDLMNTRRLLFDQLRYLDESGQEIVRINNTPQGVVSVADSLLQNKLGRYYFQQSLLLDIGEGYLSTFDLNVEQGQIEQPIKPTLRFAVRAIDGQGQPHGVVVVNYLGQDLLQRMRDIHRQAGLEFWLLNAKGDWLVSSNPEYEWGFLFPERPYQSFAVQYPPAWQAMQTKQASGVFKITSIDNVMSALHFMPEQDLIQSDFRFKAHPGSAWYLLARLPPQALILQKRALFQSYGSFYVLFVVILTPLGIGLAVLIQRRRDVLNAIVQRELEFKALLESAPDAILVTDTQGRIVIANAQAEINFGWQREELIDQPIENFIPAELRQQHQQYRAQFLAMPQTHRMREGHVLFACRADGEQFPVNVGFSSYRIGTELRVIAVIRDISEMYRLIQGEQATNQKLQDAIRKMADINRALSVSNQELESFSYSVSHDLRTPLRAIDGFSTILLQSYQNQLDEQGRDFLTRMRAAAQHMSGLIDDMLVLSRISRANLQCEDFDLSALVREAVNRLSESFPERQVETIIQPDIRANGDVRLIRIVLDNLLSNAWKFTSKTPQAQVEFGSEIYDGENMYFVRDNGAGFDMAYADKLFAAFQRLHQATDFPGSGIGLATVQRIIHKHGGQIQAESFVGQGATFRFTLPDHS